MKFGVFREIGGRWVVSLFSERAKALKDGDVVPVYKRDQTDPVYVRIGDKAGSNEHEVFFEIKEKL